MTRIRKHLTFANVASAIALFVALGGSAVAATGGNFLLGKSNSASTTTSLSSGAGQALKVTNSTAHTGVWASGGSVANNASAVHGQSTAGNGVEGISGKNTASGVYGQNNSTGFGVAGRSTSGTGVFGESSGGWAFNASGNATQARTGNGFVKAMAFVDYAGHPSDPIRQCFNSQLPPSQATSGDCGIGYYGPGDGYDHLNFGFRVDDRVVVATTRYPGEYDVVRPGTTNTVDVSAYGSQGAHSPNGYFIAVF